MGLPTGLSRSQLREVEYDAMVGKAVAPWIVEAMCETLYSMIDEAEEAGIEVSSIDDLHGIIEDLEEKRASAVEAEIENKTECEASIKRITDEMTAELQTVAATADEWKRRAEKAEYEVAEGRSNVELALERRKAFEIENRDLKALVNVLDVARGSEPRFNDVVVPFITGDATETKQTIPSRRRKKVT
jgi:hypothetical protein